MTIYTVVLIGLAWLVAHIVIGHKARLAHRAALVAVGRHIDAAVAVHARTEERFRRLDEKLQTYERTPTLQPEEILYSLARKLTKVAEIVIYTKRHIMVYYDPENESTVTRHTPVEPVGSRLIGLEKEVVPDELMKHILSPYDEGHAYGRRAQPSVSWALRFVR